MFTRAVNATLIHDLFSASRIEAVHESAARLLEFARQATGSSPTPVHDWAGLRAALDVTAAVLTNWKARGISKEGALRAEAVFGCSAHWVLTGEGHRLGAAANQRTIADLLRTSDPAIKVLEQDLRSRGLPDAELRDSLAAIDALRHPRAPKKT